MDYENFRVSGDTPLSALTHADDELYHWLKKGEEADNHKYTKREWKNGKWVYYYDNDTSKKSSNAQNKTANNTSKKVDVVTEASPKASIKSSFQNIVNNVKKSIEDAAKKVENDSKKVADDAFGAVVSGFNNATSKLDKLVSSAKEAIGKFYDDPDNIYNVTRYSYAEKLEAVKETAEWKEIVAEGNSEYAKRDKNGNIKYDVDEYLVDKKHPILDAVGDIVAGRPITTHEITKDSFVAGLKDYATTAIEVGMLALTCTANGLSRKFKYSQGSYDDDIEQAMDTVTKGAEYINDTYDIASTYVETAGQVASSSGSSPDEVIKLATKVVSNMANNVDEETLKKVTTNTIASMYPNLDEKSIDALVNGVVSGIAVAGEIASEAAKNDNVKALVDMAQAGAKASVEINEGRVVAAAQTLLESEALKEQIGQDEYWEQAEHILANMSEEEIQLLNLMVAKMREEGR